MTTATAPAPAGKQAATQSDPKEPDRGSYVPYAQRVADLQATVPSWWDEDSMFGGVKNKYIAGGTGALFLLALVARR